MFNLIEDIIRYIPIFLDNIDKHYLVSLQQDIFMLYQIFDYWKNLNLIMNFLHNLNYQNRIL